MSKVNGIYAATMSIIGNDLSLNVKKTIEHGENLIKQGCIFQSTLDTEIIIHLMATSRHHEVVDRFIDSLR